MALRLSAKQLLSLHQYQYDGTHRNRNECALCAMAMLSNMAAKSFAIKDFHLPAATLGKFLDRIPMRYARVPAWVPQVGGATHPRAAAAGLAAYIWKLNREGLSFPWQAIWRTGQSPGDLETALSARRPTLIYGVGPTGIPHVVVPIKRERGGWLVLDPGFTLNQNPRKWTEDELTSWWRRYSFLYPRGTMVSLKRV